MFVEFQQFVIEFLVDFVLLIFDFGSLKQLEQVA
jgi:hypothetical protein